MLELQQQLVVAVTADRKKDVMIEQLDKVPGWQKAGGSLRGGRRETGKVGWPPSISLFTLRAGGGFTDPREKVKITVKFHFPFLP